MDLDALRPRFREWLGREVLDFFVENEHLAVNAEERLGKLLLDHAERYLRTPLDDILYPY